ncbi:P-loop containing nucleoside triphosphate hydrolases superfamily protein [Actinidia rufa]|uniref:P-loop containing nucleoside triphosphate hydrolases superfamily protein n=1 Tax=Actinidia rufa TaxID=165716 RepID=A0A7J0FIU8_9ERIC|nr:P-loop containing nucleoside triphosphate hydrolases superfamily protein [Actinidia rufa]
MRGSTAEPGVIPLAVRDLFDIIQEASHELLQFDNFGKSVQMELLFIQCEYEDMNREFLLRMSYMEIYNEDINDLLAPEHRKLQIHESLERGIFVAGLREEIVASPEQVLELMACGESHRHIGETNMNLYSSRSHTIFRMIIESRERSEDEEAGSSCDAVRVSVLNLVDLAGSERAAKTGAEGVRLKEGSHINKSLMTLGTVIKKLSEGAESQGGHVPYRDSKLTRILQPALEGNANTAIICNITLAQIHVDETKSSLQFSSRALRVTNCARVNEILTDAALLKRQKKEIEELTAKLQGSHSDHFEEEILNLRNTLLQTELERERIALELEEEKKAQAEREKRLQEQAKKIENLSSMVLYSNRDEIRDQPKKEAREPIGLLVCSSTVCLGGNLQSQGVRREPGVITCMELNCLARNLAVEVDCSLRTEECEATLSRLRGEGLLDLLTEEDCGIAFQIPTILIAHEAKECCNVVESRSSNLHLEKRRDTWCFGNLSRETLREVNSVVHAKASAVKSMRSERFMGPLLPFEELVSEASMDNSCKEEEERHNDEVEGCVLPDPHALLHVTSRKKAAVRKKSLLAENNELEGFQAEYEDLFLKFETQRTMSEIQIDYLTRKLADADLYLDEKSNSYSTSHLNKSTIHNDATKSLRESEAILVIKQLQEKIHMLEMEKSSSQQNLDCVVELATEQNINAMEKYEELYEDLLHVQEEARMAREQIASMGSVRKIDMDNSDAMMNLLMGVQEITSEIQTTRNLGESVSMVVDELLQSFSAATNLFLDFKSLAYQNSTQLKSIISNHEKLHCCMRHKVNELESDKLLLHNQSADLQSQLQELSLHVEDSSRALNELLEKHHLEKSKLLSQIQTLEKEISSLSSSSFAREKETLRKDFEKTKSKLRETEFKLKNAIQEKTKLEGEKACAERELKKLHGQKALLERDISKRESLAGRRRDSVVDRSSNVFDPRRGKGLAVSIDQTLQEDYKRLEVLAFEMETTIASLEEELTMTNEEKEAAVSKTESLASELDALSDKLNMSNAELNRLQEEFSNLQLTEALLAMEEEKAIWSAKEKASIEAIEEKSKSYNAELMLLSNEIVEAPSRPSSSSYRGNCHSRKE